MNLLRYLAMPQLALRGPQASSQSLPVSLQTHMALSNLQIQGCTWLICPGRNSLSRGNTAKPLPWPRWEENTGEQVCAWSQAPTQCHRHPGSPLCKSLGWVLGFLRWQWPLHLEPHRLHDPLLVLELMSQISLLALGAELLDVRVKELLLKQRVRDTHVLENVLSQPQEGRGLCRNAPRRASPPAAFQMWEEPEALGSLSTQWLAFSGREDMCWPYWTTGSLIGLFITGLWGHLL